MLSSAQAAVAEMREALALLMPQTPHTPFTPNIKPSSTPSNASSPAKLSVHSSEAAGTPVSAHTTPQQQRIASRGLAGDEDEGGGSSSKKSARKRSADGEEESCQGIEDGEEDLFQVRVLGFSLQERFCCSTEIHLIANRVHDECCLIYLQIARSSKHSVLALIFLCR